TEDSRLAQLIAASKEDSGSSKSEDNSPSPARKISNLPIKELDEEDSEEYDDPPMSAVAEGDNELANTAFERQLSTVSILHRSPGARSVNVSSTSSIKSTISISESEKSPSKLITKETVETGRVKFSVYGQYVKAGGIIFMGIYFVFYVVYQGIMMVRNFWLSEWADDNDPMRGNRTKMANNTRLIVYAGFGGLEMISLSLALLGMVFGTLKASKKLHEPVLFNILRSPMSFFDTTPVGR
ncbi:hypothetical protein FO519_010570, partial [Halicephalobus sp. NKZ332]